MISIIVPIYNSELYLRQCLDSIRAQTYSDIEVIMIDDGSTDGSKDLAKYFVERDERFHLYSQENEGVSAARNAGLDKASGEYILFVDSDDWIEPRMIEALLKNMLQHNTDIACCQYDRGGEYIQEKTEIWDRETTLKNFLIHKLINGSLVNKLFKKDILNQKKLDLTIKYGEDALFLWKTLLDVRSISVFPEVLYHVTLHDDSATGGGSYKLIRKDCIKVWENISNDAAKISAELGEIARAQLGNMAFFSLYEMDYYNYHNREHEQYYLNTLRETIEYMNKANFISFAEKCLARIFLLSRNIGKILVYLKSKAR